MVDFNWHFTDNEYAQLAIETIIQSLGEAFVPPFSTDVQPIDASVFNNHELLQFDLPAGVSTKPYTELGVAQSIGSSINDLMGKLAPIFAMYGMLLPILEVIKGIIEVLCALMNPFAVKKAVKKLIKIYIPKLIALFPPLAGVVIILNIIKMILAMVFFIITVVIPTLQLVKENAKTINAAISGNGNPQQIRAGEEKIKSLIIEFINQIGVFKAFLPLLEMIMMLLGLSIKYPCKEECCESDVCPEVLKNPPKGIALVETPSYDESYPFLSFTITTRDDPRMLELNKYNQSSEQINQQLDNPINSCCPAGSESEECSNFSVKLTTARGESISAPIVKIEEGTRQSTITKARDVFDSPTISRVIIITVINPDLIKYLGKVNFEIVPNFNMLVARQVISIGCDPEIVEARLDAQLLTPNMDSPVDTEDLLPEYKRVEALLDTDADELRRLAPPYDLDNIQNIQDRMVKYLEDFADFLKRRLRSISDKYTNINNSTINVDKNVVRADNADKAIVSVTPRDSTGIAILRNFTDDAIPSIEIYTSLGSLSNKRFDKPTGSVLMDLKSPITGAAEITAKIEDKFVSSIIDGVSVVKKVSVRFVADSILPARRANPNVVDKEPKRS